MVSFTVQCITYNVICAINLTQTKNKTKKRIREKLAKMYFLVCIYVTEEIVPDNNNNKNNKKKEKNMFLDEK